jgi:O-antigen ligase
VIWSAQRAAIHRPWTIPLVVFATLLMAPILGVTLGAAQIPRMVLLLAVVGPAVLVASIVVVRFPDLSLALLPIVGVTIPFSIGTGTQSSIVAALMLAAALVCLGALRAIRAPDWPGASVSIPAVVLVTVWIMSYFWGAVEREPLVTAWPTFLSAQLGGLGVLVVSVGVLLVAMHTSWKGPWPRIATYGLIACGVVTLAVYFFGNRAQAAVFEVGGLFTMWVVALAFGQALFNTQLHGLLRIGLVTLAACWLYKALVLQTWWFSGWFPPLVAATALVCLRFKYGVVLVALLAAIIVLLRFESIYNLIWGLTVDKGDLSRLGIWQQSLDLFSRHPFLGTGPAGYAIYFQSEYAGSEFSMSTHNNYVDVLLETGSVGVLSFVWFLCAVFVTGWRACRRWRGGFEGAFAHSAFAGLLATIGAMALGDWFIPFVYNQGIGGFRFTVHSWVFLGFLAGLALIPRSPTQPEPTGAARGSLVRAYQPLASVGSTESQPPDRRLRAEPGIHPW